MELIKFRVSMYKGIIDSGWIDVNNLTVLVGKNESGKTSLLKALHKLNPYNPESYEITNEWPRNRRSEKNKEHKVCQAKFRLSAEEKEDLLKLTDGEKIPDTVEVSRNYAEQLEINFGEETVLDTPPPLEIDVSGALPEVKDTFSPEFKKCANACFDEVKRFVSEERFTELGQLAQNHTPLLKRRRVQPQDRSYNIEGQFINRYPDALNQLAQKLQQLVPPQSNAHKYITEHLPTFVYMDDYRTFSGNAYLQDIQSRENERRLTEADKTFLMILYLSNLKLDELITSGESGEEQIEQRQYDLADGADALTEVILNQFPDRRYEIEYRVDGQNFFTYVKDKPDSPLIRLEERSKGFQWFFSFDLMLMHETEGSLKGCVILLDEPGLHLHPDAQKSLLGRLEEYANGNTLLYTTHLPFMIDLNHPDRVRVLKETKDGIVVTIDFIESPPESKFVLQAALGMDASQSFLVADQNLVVEGVNDYWILTELSNLLRRGGEAGLPKDVFITPGGSASTAVHIATIMIGQNLDVVALFDSDTEGRQAQENLDHNWITQYNKARTKTILLGDAVDASGDFALEDLFPEKFITDIVKETYAKQLAAADVDEITLQGEGILWQKILRFMNGQDIKINKGPVAKRLRNKLSGMNDLSELPGETKEKAIKLFQSIREAFGRN